MQEYLSKSDSVDKRIVLICCKLFYCIEVARGDQETALRHAKSGVIMFKDWKAKQKICAVSNMNPRSVDDMTDLIEVFARLDVQMRISGQGHSPYICLTTPEERSGRMSCIPTAFQNLSDVWRATNKLLNWGSHFFAASMERKRGLPENPDIGNSAEGQFLEREVNLLITAFRVFLRNPNLKLSSAEQRSAMTASAIHRLTKAVVLLYGERKVASQLRGDFKEILDVAESIIESSPKGSEPSARGFTFETGIIASLVIVGQSCDDSAMCSRAIRLIKIWPRREGLWDGAKAPVAIERAQALIQSQSRVPKEGANVDAEHEGKFHTPSFCTILCILDEKVKHVC